MTHRTVLLALGFAAFTGAQPYKGPVPPKPDLVYIQHAQTLVPTELAQAKENKSKDDTVYVIDGATSTARTPLALPIFLVKTEKLVPDRLILYRLKIVDGHREIAMSVKRANPEPIHLDVVQVADHVYK